MSRGGETVNKVIGKRRRVGGRGVSADVTQGGAIGGRGENGVNPSVQGACRKGRPRVGKRGLRQGVVENSDGIEVVSVNGRGNHRRGRGNKKGRNKNAIKFAM
jgi:hypothetical protein